MKIIQLANGISQHTYAGGRFYQKDGVKSPSSTTVINQLAKGAYFDNFLKTNGLKSDEISKAASIKGSIVHQAIEKELRERKVTRTTDVFWNPEDEKELRIDDSPDAKDIWRAVEGFNNWYNDFQPRTVAIEETFFLPLYAGTIDLVCTTENEGEELWIIDYKTGKALYKSHELQVSSYKHSKNKYKDAKLGLLQLGTKTKKCIPGKQGVYWRFVAVEDSFPRFLELRNIWEFNTGGKFPDAPIETPEILKLPPERKLKRKKKGPSKQPSVQSVEDKGKSKQAAGL